MTSTTPTVRGQKSRGRYRPDMLMYLTAAFLWVSIWRFQDLWPILGTIQLPLILESVLVAALAMNLGGQRQFKWIKSRIFLIPFLLLLLMAAGLPVSLWPGKSFNFLTHDFVPSVVLMLAVALSLREAQDLEWMAFAYLIGAVIYSGWIYLFVSVGSDGRLGDLVYYDANDYAMLVVCTIPFALFFLRPGVALWRRLFALAALALFVQMIIKSGSRGGFIGLIALMVYVIVAFRAIPARLRIGAVAGAIFIMTVFGSAVYWNMMGTILHPKDDYNMKEQSGRKFVWKRGIGYMLQRPILGVGAAAFEQAEGSMSAISKQYAAENRGLKWSTAHNSFVLVGAELGAGGLILFVTMIGTSFVHLYRIRSGPDEDPVIQPSDAAFAQTLTASLIGYCVSGFFVSGSYFSFLYALVGFIVAEDSLRRRRHARAVTAPVLEAARSPAALQRAVPREARTHWVPAG